jgi:hypothetical protein
MLRCPVIPQQGGMLHFALPALRLPNPEYRSLSGHTPQYSLAGQRAVAHLPAFLSEPSLYFDRELPVSTRENMKRLLLAISIAMPLCVAQEPARKPAIFPLTNHSRWEFSGSAKLQGNPGKQPVRIHMEVIEVVERGAVRAAWVRGSPLGLMDHSNGPGDQVIARVGQLMYATDSARSSEVRMRIQDPADSLKDLFRDSEFLLDTALPVNPDPNPSCKSCWATSMAGSDYQITQRKLGVSRTIRFTPGVGITSFEFEDTARRESASLRLDESDVQPER